MIKADDKGVMINGSAQEIMYDFIMIIRSLRIVLAEEYNEEVSDNIITDLGKMAYLDPGDDEAFDKIIDESPFFERREKHGK